MSLRILLFSLPLFSSLIACTMTPPAGELIDGHLRPCRNRPNCLTSDSNATDRIEPISFHNSPKKAWQQIQVIIQGLGGEIVETRPMYLWATFTSTLFRFVDDVELRMEPEEKLIHIRSGARIGYSDFGANGRRIMRDTAVLLARVKQKGQLHPRILINKKHMLEPSIIQPLLDLSTMEPGQSLSLRASRVTKISTSLPTIPIS